MAVKCQSIYLCGAHSTGKTTLQADLLAHIPGAHAEEEVARIVIQQLGLTRDQFDWHSHPNVFEMLQKEILKAQSKVERSNEQMFNVTIYDRGIDPLVYALMYLGIDSYYRLVSDETIQECITRCRRSLIFVIQPHPECVFDYGYRMRPAMDELQEYTRLMFHVMNELGIKYDVIHDLDPVARCQFVLAKCRSMMEASFERT